MKLPDFREFGPFNALREKIGTRELGYFELFDPARHLTGAERSALQRSGLMLGLGDVKVLPDKTLAVKNSRVLLYYPDDGYYRLHREYPTYHLAWCSQLESAQQTAPGREYLVTTRVAEEYPLVKIKVGGAVSLVAHGFVVCKHCLHTLRYRDYDEFRNRRRAYSQRILSEFSLAEFFRRYQQYPLSFKATRRSQDG